jgi:hypothetical protein
VYSKILFFAFLFRILWSLITNFAWHINSIWVRCLGHLKFMARHAHLDPLKLKLSIFTHSKHRQSFNKNYNGLKKYRFNIFVLLFKNLNLTLNRLILIRDIDIGMEHLNSPYCMGMGMEAVIRWHRIGCKIINYWQKYLFLKSHPKIEQHPKNNVYVFLRNLLPRYFTSFINLTTLVFHENNANSENQWLVVSVYFFLLWIVELARFQKVSFFFCTPTVWLY